MNSCKHCGAYGTAYVKGIAYPIVNGACINCKELEFSLGESVFQQVVQLATRIADSRIDERKYELSDD